MFLPTKAFLFEPTILLDFPTIFWATGMAEASEADGQAEAKTFEEFQCHSTTLICKCSWLSMAFFSRPG